MYLAPDRTFDVVDQLAAEFRAAEPFPHVVIDSALGNDGAEIVRSFPAASWEGWHRYRDEYQHGKMICSQFELLPSPIQQLITELSSPKFLSWLETVSGISGLLPDPYLEGGGLHCSGPGGILATHTDFHLYPRLGIYRRLNLLLYLNETWQEDWGGCLELFAPGSDTPGDAPAKTVVPGLGTCVIFRTDDRSPHGFARPITGDRWRRSLALYYYTATEADEYSGDTNTYWRQNREERVGRRVRQSIYRALIFVSRGLAYVAHRIDPKLTRR
ncbi:MAG: 2OG-Fe(II) oxygenase [Frankiaceae bacterium]|nr:2OG-Fe(II) oxygenase [Frankiaceae bacterium]MBV9870273.1 2OG-Fe(II) oxygenase [Frankiaceae bacterium]